MPPNLRSFSTFVPGAEIAEDDWLDDHQQQHEEYAVEQQPISSREQSWKYDDYENNDRTHQAIHDAAVYARGVAAVEVWTLGDDGRLQRVGHFENGAYQELQAPPNPVAPGVGLAGILWATAADRKRSGPEEFSGSGENHHHRAGILWAAETPHHQSNNEHEQHHPHFPELLHHHHHDYHVQWRHLADIEQDPLAAKDEQWHVYMRAGLHSAAAVPFARGLVIYLAPHVTEHMHELEFELGMITSADVIASALAASKARRTLMRRYQAKESNKSIASSVKKEKAQRQVDDERSVQLDKVTMPMDDCNICSKCRTWLDKCKGGNAEIPPALPWHEGFYTLLGCLCGLVMLNGFNEAVRKYSNEEYNLILAPFGALMTLQYGLSSAPASQPRNVILGQIVAGAVSLAFTHVPLGDLCQQAVGPAFAITAMVVLGIPHPPAGAHAVIYAGGGYGWMSYMLVILASILTVVPATMVNNLSEKRQYPTFWGYLPRWLSGQVTLINKKTVASNDGEKVPVKRGSDKGEKETAV